MTNAPVMTAAEVGAFLNDAFPQIAREAEAFAIEDVREGEAVIRFVPEDRHLRPGDTVSGPALFTLVDYAAYVLVLTHLGPMALAVTTSANLNFLVRPVPGPLLCVCRMLKRGRRLVVCDALVTDEAGTPVAQASLTYSVPPAASDAAR